MRAVGVGLSHPELDDDLGLWVRSWRLTSRWKNSVVVKRPILVSALIFWLKSNGMT